MVAKKPQIFPLNPQKQKSPSLQDLINLSKTPHGKSKMLSCCGASHQSPESFLHTKRGE
jgi:hypothetical protein